MTLSGRTPLLDFLLDRVAAPQLPAEIVRLAEFLGPQFDRETAEAVADRLIAATEDAAALRRAAEALLTQPGAWAQFVAVRLLTELGDTAAALAAAGRTLERLPGPEPFVLLMRARLLARLERWAEAAADLRSALQLFPPYGFFAKGEKLLQRVAESGGWMPRRRAKAAVLSSSNTALLAPLLRAAGFRCGIAWEVYEPPFGAYRQEILDANSGLYRFAPDVVFLLVNHRDLALPPVGGQAQAAEFADDLQRLWDAIHQRLPCHIVQTTMDLPPHGAWGNLEDTRDDGRRRAIRAANEQLLAALPGGVSLVDADAVAAEVGAAFHSDAEWFAARQHPAAAALPLWADRLHAHAAAALGLSAKVLVSDLDNTLWGGVVGEDLLGGIRIGPPSAEGEGFVELQRYLKELKQRGVLLAVCSKNNRADAELPFRQHDAMLLRLDDFAVFVANWDDKPSNLRAMAQELDLGMDSFVLLDDNPLERAVVRAALPEVVVPECGRQPWEMLAALRRGQWFETVTMTAEDLARPAAYRENAARRELQRGASSLEEFLAGLNMAAEDGPVDEPTLVRVTQLINKTNQFNLTARRYSQEAVRAMARSPQWWCRWFKLSDRFGEHGLVGVILARKDVPAWTVDVWLMSCRVLGRRMEDYMAGVLLRAAQAEGAAAVCGEYVPTEKNALVADLYPRLGFEPVPGQPSQFVFDVRRQLPPACAFIQGCRPSAT